MVDAKKVKDMVAKKTNKIMGAVNGSSGKIQPHKHCRICHTTIPLAAEPRVCTSEECVEKNERDEKNQRTVRILMFVFFGLFAAPYLISLAMQVIG